MRMLRATTSRVTVVVCTWLVGFCLSFCGVMWGAEPEKACHRAKQSQCPQMSPAKCVGQAFDVPKTPVVVDGVRAAAAVVLRPEADAEWWSGLEGGRAVDRNVWLRVFRI
jgi:hypothetical protein